MLSLNEWITASGKYPERAKSYELNAQVIKNAKVLLQRVNAMLEFLGVNDAQITSGFRPSNINKALPNSAKHSAHLTGEAIDLYDPDESLEKLITVSVLKQFDLYREDSEYSIGWCHIQTRPTKSGKRIFIP